ncbi:MAG: GAF domain-containing protein [Brevinema sp.]
MMQGDIKVLEDLIKHLNQISYLESSIQQSHNMEEMLNIVLSECIKLTKATGGSIMFRDIPSDRLYYYVFQGLDPQIVSQSKMKVGDGIVGTAIKEGIPKIINNISLDPKYISLHPNMNSEIVVPIKINNFTLGALSLDHEKKNAFTETHLEFIQRIAGATGFAVRLFLEQTLRQRTANLLAILSNENSSRSSEEIFQSIAEGIGAIGACVINQHNEVQFSYGTLCSPARFEEENNTSYALRSLPILNEQGIPYCRISVHRQTGDMVFLADKTYMYMEDPLQDQAFADKLLLLISRKDIKIANQNVERETISEWAIRKMSEPDGLVYDNAIGEIEKALITEALVRNNGNRLKTALFLGINRNTLRHKMDLYSLE